MCQNLDRMKLKDEPTDKTKSAILTLYPLQLHFCSLFFLKKNVKDSNVTQMYLYMFQNSFKNCATEMSLNYLHEAALY